MSEEGAREAYQAIAAALTAVGFGWVPQQIEDALRAKSGAADSPAPDSPTVDAPSWLQHLQHLLPAIRTSIAEPSEIARRLMRTPDESAAEFSLRGGLREPVQWRTATDDVAQRPVDLWPFGIPGLDDLLAAVARDFES